MSREISDPQARLRFEWARAALMALENCRREDADAVCAAWLDASGAGDPPFDPWGDLRADAKFWADCASPPELEVYFASALKRLGNQALGLRARKRLFTALWASFSLSDQKAFLARVDADGCFHGKGAA